jgi:hypothetical protein
VTPIIAALQALSVRTGSFERCEIAQNQNARGATSWNRYRAWSLAQGYRRSSEALSRPPHIAPLFREKAALVHSILISRVKPCERRIRRLPSKPGLSHGHRGFSRANRAAREKAGVIE